MKEYFDWKIHPESTAKISLESLDSVQLPHHSMGVTKIENGFIITLTIKYPFRILKNFLVLNTITIAEIRTGSDIFNRTDPKTIQVVFRIMKEVHSRIIDSFSSHQDLKNIPLPIWDDEAIQTMAVRLLNSKFDFLN